MKSYGILFGVSDLDLYVEAEFFGGFNFFFMCIILRGSSPQINHAAFRYSEAGKAKICKKKKKKFLQSQTFWSSPRYNNLFFAASVPLLISLRKLKPSASCVMEQWMNKWESPHSPPAGGSPGTLPAPDARARFRSGRSLPVSPKFLSVFPWCCDYEIILQLALQLRRGDVSQRLRAGAFSF